MSSFEIGLKSPKEVVNDSGAEGLLKSLVALSSDNVKYVVTFNHDDTELIWAHVVKPPKSEGENQNKSDNTERLPFPCNECYLSEGCPFDKIKNVGCWRFKTATVS